MKYLTHIVVFVSVLIAFRVTPVFADEIDTLFLQGNELYQNGDFAGARRNYEKILEAGFESWEVYYNIGNTYYKEGKTGKAVLFYERAKRLQPQNEDLNFNLGLVNLATVDRIQAIPELFLTRWVNRIAHLVSLSVWGTLLVLSYVGLFSLLIYRRLMKTGKFYRPVVVSIMVLALVFAVSAGFFVYRVSESEHKIEAIVLAEKVDARSAPDEISTEVFTLHEGVKVQVLDKSAQWVKIRLADGKVGWLKNDVMEKI